MKAEYEEADAVAENDQTYLQDDYPEYYEYSDFNEENFQKQENLHHQNHQNHRQRGQFSYKDKSDKEKKSPLPRYPIVNYQKVRELEEKDNIKPLNIRNHTVYFPKKQAYEVQIKYMDKVLEAIDTKQNAILQSPTGTGKTLCLLAASLSWLEEQIKQGGKRVPKIIYLSRTHSQLLQVQRQLKRTCFLPTISIYASRENLCIQTQKQKILSARQRKRGTELRNLCEAEVETHKRIRKIKKSQDSLKDQKQLELASLYSLKPCQFYSLQPEDTRTDRNFLIAQKHFQHKIIDLEEIQAKGKEHGFCPYYYPYRMSELSDLYFMPYNYLMDSGLLARYNKLVKDNIIIIDEAHNVPETVSTGSSIKISNKQIKMAIQELQELQKLSSMSQNLASILYPQNVRRLINSFLDLKEIMRDFCYREQYQKMAFEQGNINPEDQNQSKYFIINSKNTFTSFYEILYAKLTKQERQMFEKEQKCKQYGEKMNKMIKNLNEIAIQTYSIIKAVEKQEKRQMVKHLGVVVKFLYKIRDLMRPSLGRKDFQQKFEDDINHYRIILRKPLNQWVKGIKVDEFSIELNCLVSSVGFKAFIQRSKPRCVLLTSGTLLPLESWEKELGIKFGVKLENDHLIDPYKQVRTHILTKGTLATGRQKFLWLGNYMKYKEDSIYKDLIDTVIKISQVVPNGILLVFTSFKKVQTFREKLERNNREDYQRLRKHKAIIYQEKQNYRYIDDYERRAVKEQGAILCCVFRSKVSEGIDFKDKLCRAVILVGVPMLHREDPFIQEKMNHFEKLREKYGEQQAMDPNIWYNQMAMRPVCQAIGRVIRHAKDYGMIFLLDDRYRSDKKLHSQLPKWAIQCEEIHSQVSKDFFDRIQEFFALKAEEQVETSS